MAWEWMFGCLGIVMTADPLIAILPQLDSNMLSICVRFYYQILRNDFVKKRVVQVPSWKHPLFFIFFLKKSGWHLTEGIISGPFLSAFSPRWKLPPCFQPPVDPWTSRPLALTVVCDFEGFKVIWLLLSGLFGVPAKNAEKFCVNEMMTFICCIYTYTVVFIYAHT